MARIPLFSHLYSYLSVIGVSGVAIIIKLRGILLCVDTYGLFWQLIFINGWAYWRRLDLYSSNLVYICKCTCVDSRTLTYIHQFVANCVWLYHMPLKCLKLKLNIIVPLNFENSVTIGFMSKVEGEWYNAMFVFLYYFVCTQFFASCCLAPTSLYCALMIVVAQKLVAKWVVIVWVETW